MTVEAPSKTPLDPLIELLLIALLAFMPAALGTVDAWSELIAFTAGGVIAILLGLRALLRRGSSIRPSLAWGAVVLFTVVSAAQLLPLPMKALQAVSPQTAEMKTRLLGDLPDAPAILARQPLSFYPLATRHDLRVVLLAITVFAAVVTVYSDQRRIRRLLAAVALIGGACALLAVAQDVTQTNRIYWRLSISVPARSGPFVNHSHFGQFMNLSIGAALALLLVRLAEEPHASNARRLRRIAWLGGVVILGLATIALSLTRGGMISILAAGALTVLMLLASRNLRGMAGVILLLAMLAGGLMLYVGADRLAARWAQTDGVGARVQMLHDVTAMVKHFPMTGTGLGSFEWIYPAYDRTGSPTTASHLENEYLQALLETGVLGLAAVLAFVVAIAAAYLRAMRHRDRHRALAAAGLGYGLFAVMVHSLSDFGQHLPSIAALSAVTCGLLLNLGRAHTGRTIAMPLPRRAAALLLAAAVAVWSVRDAHAAWQAERYWRPAERLARELADEDWEVPDEQYRQLFAQADRAVAAEPDNAYYRYWRALYRWRWVSNQRDEESGRVAVNPQTVATAQRIVGELNAARERCPTYGLVYTLLGQIELKFLNRPIGMEHIEMGYELARNDPTACFLAGQVAARRDNWELAQRRFHEAMRLDWESVDDIIGVYLYQVERPELAASAVGDDFLALIRLRDELRTDPKWKALSESVEVRAYDVVEAQVRNPDAPVWKLATLAAFRTDQARYDDANRYLARALEVEPGNLDWQLRRVDVLTKLGRTAEAIVEARRAVFMHPNSPEARKALETLTP